MKPFDFQGCDKEYLAPGIPCLHSTFDTCMEDFAPYVKPASKWRSRLAYGIVKMVNTSVQKKLMSLQNNGPRNWFYESVEQLYLECREGLPFFNHFCVSLNVPSEKPYAERIADIINATIELTRSSQSIAKTFRCYRQADLVCDTLSHGQPDDYFILLCNGNAYTFPNILISALDIEKILEITLIVNNKNEITLGQMSAFTRERWYDLEQSLSIENDFTKTMQALRNSDFIICLDTQEYGANSSLNGEQFKFRNIHNRFFDKAIQVVVDHENTYLLFEHAAVDGQYAVELCAELAGAIKRENRFIPKHEGAFYEELKFAWGNQLTLQQRQKITSYIRTKKSEFSWFHSQDSRFSKEFFEGLPIDSIIQFSTHLAYYRCTDKFPSVYEPVSLRHIAGRRLDFISSFSNAAKYFIEAAIQNDHVRARAALDDAINYHKRKIKHAKKGAGAMSHIMALSAAEFSDNRIKGIRIQRARKAVLSKLSSSFKYLIRRDLMASNGGYSNYINGFGTIIHQTDMVGIGYLVNQNGLSIDIQIHGSYREIIGPNRFLKYLVESVFYITNLLRNSHKSELLLHGSSKKRREM